MAVAAFLLSNGVVVMANSDLSATIAGFSRPESPAPGLVQQAGTPGHYGELMPLSSTFFSPTDISLRNSIG
jgi:hypothetical protein